MKINMKSNSFVYTTAIVLIAHLINWFILTPTILYTHWWRTFLDWHWVRRRKRQYNRHHHHHDENITRTMYEFRPFEVTQCEYKRYGKSGGIGRGINFIPKARSGHRCAANESDLFSFGGMKLLYRNCLFFFFL